MINKNLIFLLSILVLLLNQVHVNAVAQEYVPRNIDVERSPKNILVGSYVGGRSHLKPMLDVTTILIERGHNVILLTSGKYEPSSEYPGLKQITLGSKSLTAKNDRRINIHKEVDYRTMGKFMELATATYNVTYEKFKNAAKEDNIDLFICDALVNQACIDVANNLNKPLVGFTSFMQMMEPKPYKSDPMYGCNISLENESFFERFRCTLIQPLQIAYAYGPSIRKLNDIKGQMNINPVSEKEPKFSLSLVDTFFGFELPQSSAPNVQEIGPVLSEVYPPLTPELSDFINGHIRVLYVAFGTRFYTTIENNNKILQSLYEAINNKMVDGVVWALSETSKDDFSPTLNFIDGTQVQTLPILNNEHPHIHITKFAPQFAVLNHTNTKLFFSHGGAGSTHESLYTGTPMLVLPFGGDQMGNAQRLETAGIALSLNKNALDVKDILNKVNVLLNDEHVKKNSKRMKYLARINSNRKYRAADLIEYMLYSSGLNEYLDDDFLKEWIPAESRMGFIKANNLDVYGSLLIIIPALIGIAFNLIKHTSNSLFNRKKSKQA
ncbi:glycosyltransferase family 1 protein [Rhizophagus irregularis DAOM 181602=DAOM 197198]|uniref:Glycosyltransferase family 1 protein n=1 Tax=Rhizophagus irregularis (strain DAOM 181602 / DAOM 197198 / MUCL 43194) TaxID=747089 RepID=A0A2P4QTI4_RHIID|nr:glycosyltransferase family 1 protein [Rhizophagus irregularis DAOM 181602=DAOM 197198]POG80956.1 glycosyltransferase family 1 protein [Rhizophagus irregularis DAOM 181602=DAOM 197198]|eukprot:XP_025187822.1 glycosyltransferase family 1 protein [Rhizophagus irregularis DAOM 181602=DAOM 197198]